MIYSLGIVSARALRWGLRETFNEFHSYVQFSRRSIKIHASKGTKPTLRLERQWGVGRPLRRTKKSYKKKCCRNLSERVPWKLQTQSSWRTLKVCLPWKCSNFKKRPNWAIKFWVYGGGFGWWKPWAEEATGLTKKKRGKSEVMGSR